MKKPSKVFIESTMFPSWPWRLALPDGTTFKKFKSIEKLNAWLDRNGYGTLAPRQGL